MIRRLQILGGLVGAAFFASNVIDAWREVAAHPVPIVVWRIGLATLLLVGVYGGLVAMWRLMARELGAHVRFGAAVQFWSISNLGRYVPGKIWQITGVILAASSFGVQPGIAAVISLLSFGLMITTGAVLGFAFLPGVLPAAARPFVWGGAALVIVLPIVQPRWLRDAMQRLPGFLCVRDPVIPTRAGMLRVTAAFFVMWLAHGFAFWVFCTGFADVAWSEIPVAIGAFTLAYVAGLAALFAPGGIGVREEILGAALRQTSNGLPVHLLAVSARLWTMFAELVILSIALVWRWRTRRTS